MKQYNKIYVPDNKGELEVCDILTGTPKLGKLSEQENMVVCTIEELGELWVAGSLSQYLESKGLTIKQQ